MLDKRWSRADLPNDAAVGHGCPNPDDTDGEIGVSDSGYSVRTQRAAAKDRGQGSRPAGRRLRRLGPEARRQAVGAPGRVRA